MFEDSGFALPSSLARRVFALVVWLVVIATDLVVYVIRCCGWAPWCRFVGTVVLAVVVVLLLRSPAPHPIR